MSWRYAVIILKLFLVRFVFRCLRVGGEILGEDEGNEGRDGQA